MQRSKLSRQQIEGRVTRRDGVGIRMRTPSNAAATITCIDSVEELCTGRCSSTSAEDLSGSGSRVMTCGSPRVTAPVSVRLTPCHKPVSRSRMAGIQSQPSVATNVGPSITRKPPSGPGPPLINCSCGIPGCGGGDMRTARAFTAFGRSTWVTSKSPRQKPRESAPIAGQSAAPLPHS